MAARAGIPEHKIIRLNANENPYGPSPRVASALASIQPQIYTDPRQRRVRKALSEFTGFDSDRIVVGAGSDEIIDLLFRLTVEPGDSVVECAPHVRDVQLRRQAGGGRVPVGPSRRTGSRSTLRRPWTPSIRPRKWSSINSPNNPTGNIATAEQMESLLGTGVLVVVDEAYFEFAGESAAGMLAEHENLAVLRTMSKWAALAGLRVGYGIMSPALVKYLLDIKQPYNVTEAGEVALLASLADSEYLMSNVGLIVRERERLFALLEGIPGVTPLPSRGNYILCKLPQGRARQIFDRLAGRGIFLRMFGHERLRDCIRTSVGTPEQTDALVGALRELV